MWTTHEIISLAKVTVKIMMQTANDLFELWTTGNITKKD